MPINDSVYILDPEFEHIGKQLISKGITVEYIDFEINITKECIEGLKEIRDTEIYIIEKNNE
ncbi:MAG: hypothetical protein E7J25_15755, partial [Paeniclostridium sordellii]|nr:hypothetical protein [Paeniclostridium sordellii]